MNWIIIFITFINLFSEINVLRCTLEEINKKAKLDSNGELIINDKIIGLVYFRGGYDEKDFPNEVLKFF